MGDFLMGGLFFYAVIKKIVSLIFLSCANTNFYLYAKNRNSNRHYSPGVSR